MDLKFAYDNVVVPALHMLPLSADSFDARVMLLTVGLQESRFKYRVQMGGGPAHSFWQMEEGGGVRGVNTHPASRELARKVCAARDCPFEHHAVWLQLANDDLLGAVYARLLLLTDPKALPVNASEGWAYYLHNWRPGKPHPETWDAHYQQAITLVKT